MLLRDPCRLSQQTLPWHFYVTVDKFPLVIAEPGIKP